MRCVNDNPCEFEQTLMTKFRYFDVTRTNAEMTECHLYLRRFYLHRKQSVTVFSDLQDALSRVQNIYDIIGIEAPWVRPRNDEFQKFLGLCLQNFTPTSLYLHHIVKCNKDPDLHDHAYDFGVYILNGGYTERLVSGDKRHLAGSYRVMAGDTVHQIISIDTDPLWALVVAGEPYRTWGYNKVEWKPWMEYHNVKGYELNKTNPLIDIDSREML